MQSTDMKSKFAKSMLIEPTRMDPLQMDSKSLGSTLSEPSNLESTQDASSLDIRPPPSADLGQDQLDLSSKSTFVCQHCSKSYAKKRTMLMHLNAVHMKVRLSCPHCNLTFRWPSDVSRHIRKKHRGRVSSATEPHPGLDESAKGNEQVFCQHCSKSYTTKSSMLMHVNAVHMRVRSSCPHCNLTFRWATGVYRHIKKKHRGRVSSATESHHGLDVSEKGNWQVICPECNQSFTSNESILRHWKNSCAGQILTDEPRVIDDESPLIGVGRRQEDICQVFFADNEVSGGCQEDFADQDVPEPLVAIGRGESIHRFACEQCNFSTKHSTSLTRHVQSIHDKIRFQCQHCNCSYSLKGSLILHVREKHSRQLEESQSEGSDPIILQEFSLQGSIGQVFSDVGHEPEKKAMEEIVALTGENKPEIGEVYNCTWCSYICKVSKEVMEGHLQENHCLTLEEYMEMNKITF